MARGQHTFGQFTRGAEVAGNYLAMARASLARQVGWSLVIAMALGAWSLMQTVSPPQRALFGDFVECALFDVFGNDRLRTQRSTTYSCEEILNLYGGRRLGYFGRQLVFRTGVCALAAFATFTVALTWFGRYIGANKRLRGARVVDLTRKRSGAWWAPVRRMGVLFLCLVPVLGFLAQWRFPVLGDYVLALAGLKIPTLAQWLSASGDGEWLWFDGLAAPGFYRPRDVLVYLGEMPRVLMVRLFEVAAITAILIAWAPCRKRRSQKGREPLTLGQLPVSPEHESYHFLLCGSPGSGKSTAIKNQLDQVRERCEKAVVYDCSGEYISVFYRPGRDVILNPMDSRSRAWTLFAEAKRREDYYTLARSLFPAEGRDPFWADAGAQLFASVAEVVAREPGANNRKLADLLLRTPLSELYQLLAGTPGARLLDPDAGPMPTNVLATVASKIGVWDSLCDAPGEAFSIRAFIESDDDRWLFLSSRRDQHELIKPLLSLWCDIASAAILSLPPAERRRWIILDELASLQKLPALPVLLERGRKHGAAVVLGLQSIAQLRTAYGHDGAAALASQAQTWLCLRSVEPDTARWLEGALCSVEQEEVQESLSMGAASLRDGISLQHAKHLRPIVMASEIMTLPDLTGFVKRPCDDTVYRVSYAYRQRNEVSPGFVDTHAQEAAA